MKQSLSDEKTTNRGRQVYPSEREKEENLEEVFGDFIYNPAFGTEYQYLFCTSNSKTIEQNF
jgi:hypothetical protein